MSIKGTAKNLKGIHKVTQIRLNEPDDNCSSVNSVRASIVNNRPRPGAMSTDKIRPDMRNLLGPKSSDVASDPRKNIPKPLILKDETPQASRGLILILI